jgi:hypothetical protein
MYGRFLIIAVFATLMSDAAPAQSASSPNGARVSSIGYPSVAAALEAMRAKSGVKVSVQGGWTIVDDRGNSALWSFTPPGHPAHPAVVRRTVTEKDGAIFVQMGGLCEAAKPPCDKLMAEFRELTERMRRQIERDRNQKPK